jgi:hypothetical protein
MVKNFPKSRICVIDCYEAFQAGLQKAINFAKHHNITLNSIDGKKIILGFCLKSIELECSNVSSPYQKVLCLSEKSIAKNLKPFVDNHFNKMMSCLPLPYCGEIELTSPDLEMIAERSLKKYKPIRKFKKFLHLNRIKM